MARRSKYSPEVRERAVRMVREHGPEHATQWAAITSIAGKFGCTAETLRKWVRQAEVDAGEAPGVPTESAREIRELKRKNAELERTIEILKAATGFFVRESDPQRR